MTALLQTADKPAPIQPKPKRITTAWLARELEKELANFSGE
ncbi:hypothetical protein FHW00_004649 [Ochrobactrum sp. P6BSIII]|nr:hypothetical protein [Ochrobactrum sp. P6BSIII]